MAVGFGNIDNFQETIQATVDNAVGFARMSLQGTGTEFCLECGKEIPIARRRALPSATKCVGCQSLHDKQYKDTYYDRRCSKDSQLR